MNRILRFRNITRVVQKIGNARVLNINIMQCPYTHKFPLRFLPEKGLSLILYLCYLLSLYIILKMFLETILKSRNTIVSFKNFVTQNFWKLNCCNLCVHITGLCTLRYCLKVLFYTFFEWSLYRCWEKLFTAVSLQQIFLTLKCK